MAATVTDRLLVEGMVALPCLNPAVTHMVVPVTAVEVMVMVQVLVGLHQVCIIYALKYYIISSTHLYYTGRRGRPMFGRPPRRRAGGGCVAW
jgi:hypothetical protein